MTDAARTDPPPDERRQEIYLDSHATTPCDPRVLDAMLPVFTGAFGNAASLQHATGREAARLVEGAREQVAALLGASPREIVFTSGATEADNLAIKGAAAAAGSRRHAITTAIEHKAVLDSCRALERQGFRITYVPVTAEGLVRAEDVEAAIEPDTFLISVMFANNEIGTVLPLAAIGAIAKRHGILFHSDAVQALPYLRCDVDAIGVDLLALSAHKMYGPKGAGALYVRRRKPHVRLAPQIDGGGHERGLRSGTLNVPGIVGLGVAAALVQELREEEARRTAALRDRLRDRLLEAVPDTVVNGSTSARLPNNLNVTVPGVHAERVLAVLEGVAISSGAACSSPSAIGSHVLRSLGDGRDAYGSLRFGLGRFTTAQEVELAAERVAAAIGRARETASGHDEAPCDVRCPA